MACGTTLVSQKVLECNFFIICNIMEKCTNGLNLNWTLFNGLKMCVKRLWKVYTAWLKCYISPCWKALFNDFTWVWRTRISATIIFEIRFACETKKLILLSLGVKKTDSLYYFFPLFIPGVREEVCIPHLDKFFPRGLSTIYCGKQLI